MVLAAFVIAASLLVDRALGDPRTPLHPVALLGRFIGWWGVPSRYPVRLQRIAGVFLCLLTASLFAAPFLLFERLAPWYLYLIAGPFMLKACFAWRALEEHTRAVADALSTDIGSGRKQAAMMVSRETSDLGGEEVLSAAYESLTENLVDSIIAPLLYFAVFGLAGAAFYRAANTMDAMLGYRDEREQLGWCPARLDDLLTFIPARAAGIILLGYFAVRGRFSEAYAALRRDAQKRPGPNGGIPMAIIAGGVGVRFRKPGGYEIGIPERALEAAGDDLIRAVRSALLIFALIAIAALFLLQAMSNT
ncbi:MAG: adenosylcobinamide-phosphate synthase CbiB [Methanomicrobiaceae archaeon]|nr:adenosylcobinamide-phosphate synthase CbiB [Methanomicrobiaceae archaeon]MDD5420315.1 adenosylcobinamide-phosphate synthase CbiB [Methanomicrobiaceae archaeon]